MVNLDKARSMLLKLEGTEERLHWDRPAFQANKKIFATLWPKENKVVLKFTMEQQSVYLQVDPEIFSPVPGAWGRKGYTCISMQKITTAMFSEVIARARESVHSL